MESVAVDPRHADPSAPRFSLEELELLGAFHAMPATATLHQPPQSQCQSTTANGHHLPHRRASMTTSPKSNLAISIKKTNRSSSSAMPTTLSPSGADGVTSSSTSSPPPMSPPHNNQLTNLSTEDSRREKNRQKVRRHYYRKLTLLTSLRSEVEQLEGHFQSLLQQPKSPHSLPLHDCRLNDLTLSRTALENEREQLRRLVGIQQSHYTQLCDLLATEHALFMSTHLAKAIFIKTLSVAECHAVRDKAVADVMLLTQRPRRSGANHGMAGWHDDVTVDHGFWKYSLHKTFGHVAPAVLCDRSWPMVTDPNVFSRLYSPAVEAKCVIVQHVDDRNLVMFQEYRAMDASNEYVLMKSLFLVSRVTSSTGELILIRGLGVDRLHDRELFLPSAGELAGRVVWHDLFTWTKFDCTGLGGEDCVVQFGGSAPTVGNNMSFWSVEILNLVVRWECAIHGPPQLLSTTEKETSDSRPTPPSILVFP